MFLDGISIDGVELYEPYEPYILGCGGERTRTQSIFGVIVVCKDIRRDAGGGTVRFIYALR